MTRKSEGATAGLRRGRTLATAGLGAATLIGGLIYAMPANAATNPTASVAMPASILNDGSQTQPFSITLTGGSANLTDLGYKFTLSVPGDASCAGVAVTLPASGIGSTLTQTGCTWSTTVGGGLATLAAGATVTDNYTLKVTDPTSTGSVALAFELDQDNSTGGYLSTLATASGSTTLASPAAGTFTKPAPAYVKQNYTQQLFTAPSGGVVPAGYPEVYVSHVYTSGTGVKTTCYSLDTNTTNVTAAGVTTTYTDLNDGLELDPATGKIISNPTANAANTATIPSAITITGTDSNPESYIVVLNNGQGGAAATAVNAGTTCPDDNPAGTRSYSAVPVALHDVSSGAFQIPVLFTDVKPGSTFATQIYGLGDNGWIQGYADGSFQPANDISREAMASMLDGGPGGNCGVGNSPYTDVSYASQFCTAIADTTAEGLFNGYNDGSFHPAANISRQAIAAVIFRDDARLRGVGSPGDAACTTPVPFNDVSAQSPFCGDIEWGKNNNIINGYADGGFHPTAPSSRQAVASFLYKVLVKDDQL